MMEIGSEKTPAEATVRPDYEPPRIEELGTVEELTMGAATAGPDFSAIFGSMSVSDRRLKHGIAPVDPGWVLDRLGSARAPRP